MKKTITNWLPDKWRRTSKMLIALGLILGSSTVLHAQAPSNDECSGAITLIPGITCVNTAGTTVGATLSMAAAPCSGNPDDDVWYSFVATATDIKIDLSGVVAVVGGSTDMYFQVLSGTCGSLTSIYCSDPNSAIVGGLTVGGTYYIRVYSYGQSTTATFNICLTNLSSAPTSCASLSSPANNGQTSASPLLSWNSVTNATSYDVYLGTTNPPTTVVATVSNATSYAVSPALPLGDYYWYIIPKNSQGAATGCATNTCKLTVITAPANDECANAISLTQGTTCTNTAGTTAGATFSMASSPCSGNPDDDVWYSFVASATDAKIDLSSVVAVLGSSTDIYFQVLSGPCGSLTSLLCSDPNSAIVGDLTVGQTYYIRVYTYGAGNAATFNICVTTPPVPTSCATLSIPANNASTGATPTLTWSSVTNASAYDVYIGTVNPPTTLAATVATTSYSITSALPFGDYYWYIVPKNSSGAPSGCSSNTRKFTTIPQPANDDCPGAISLTVNPDFSCGVTATGNTAAATQSTETAPSVNSPGTNDDVWYKFIATNSSHRISLSNVSSATDMAMAIYSGNCGSLVHIQSSDPDVMNITGLTPGTEYKIRVYTYTSTVSTTASFTICIGTAPPPPTNDEATAAITLSVNGGCTGNPYHNIGATQSGSEPYASCYQTTNTGTGTTASQHTVWFKFVAPTSGSVRVSTDIGDVTGLTDTHIGLFNAGNVSDYATFTILGCDDDNGTTVANGGTATNRSVLYATGLTGGQTYYVSVDGYNGTTGAFCIGVDELNSSFLSTTNTCSSTYQAPSGSNTAYNGWISIVDASSKLVALVRNAAGSSVSTYTAAQNINTAGIRQDANGLKYLDRNFRISHSGAGTYDVQLFFLAAEQAALETADPAATLAGLNITRQTGESSCTNNFSSGGTNTSIPQAGSGSVNGVSWISFTTPGFSNFFLNSGNTPLPVDVAFTGKNAGSVNNLDWKTSSEVNFSHFELQRSADGTSFSKLATISSKGIATGSQYSYTDERPFDGKNYYRLNMVDRDGKSAFSDIVTLVAQPGTGLDVNVHPNPVSQQLNVEITGKRDAHAQVMVLDIAGKVLQTIPANSNTVSVDMSRLSPGIYMIRYTDNSHNTVIKVNKN